MANAREYLEQMAREAGLSPEETQAFVGFAQNPKLTSRLDGLVKTATEDYNAQLGRVRAAEESKRAWEEWAQGNAAAGKPGAVAQYNALQEAYAQEHAELERIRAAAGVQVANGQPPTQPQPGQYLTPADLLKFTQDLDTRWSRTLKQSNYITARHVKEFQEEPDFDKIEEIARAKNYLDQPDGLRRAYDEWVQPRVSARAEESRKKWEADVRAEAIRDARAQVGAPPVSADMEQPLIYSDKAPNPGEGSDADLLATFNAAAKP